jgi:predicted CopG family antitoxin
VTKTVALSEDAYASLARLKKPGQSFSDVVEELVDERRPRLEDVLDEPTPEASAHWEAFQEERRERRRTHRSRVDLEE